jgi:hypothetical protein
MSKTEILGPVAEVNQPAEKVFATFSDLSNFTKNLPEDKRDQVTATPDTLVAMAQGMQLGIQVVARVPFETIRFEQYGATPLFPFTLWIHLKDLLDGRSSLQLEFHAELNMLFKMMLEPKLKDGIAKITEQIAAGINQQGANF